MQFIADGPDIPNILIQAHEEGRVVFFCGAGISYPAGLPSFGGLVKRIYELTDTMCYPDEQDAFKRGQFDSALNLLERRLPGQRREVRQALAEALKPKLRRTGATDTHAALLQLAHSRDGALRLVTTNFDRVFQAAAKRIKQPLPHYTAPMLPIPKDSRWDGLVYLHGLLPETINIAALNHLVLTSGDFGLAYLTERWAARFVSELFRNYVVCFVGYSINDPVLRYMMDALAADRMMGESTPQAWALGGYKPGDEERETVGWEAKGVTPILYNDAHDHAALHNTLQKWAETYRDGTLGKEQIVATHARAHPSASTQQDDFVGRMLWALSDQSGLPAKRFAECNPAPALEWLWVALADARYQHVDLAHFGVPPHSVVDEKLRFSLVRRPVVYSLAPFMSLVSGGISKTNWDAIMLQLARWLVRHLNDPRLILWVAELGGRLHEHFADIIEYKLNYFKKLELEGNATELDNIRRDSPNAIPDSEMQTLWRLLLGEHVISLSQDLNLYHWKDRLQRDGLTATLRFELRALLAPKITLKKPFNWPETAQNTDPSSFPRKPIDWELVLASAHVRSTLKDNNTQWNSALPLPLLLNDVQQLLYDALDLLHELGDADDCNDHSRWAMPSISPHWQNRDFHDWTILIEMLRDAWLTVNAEDTHRAMRVAQTWYEFPYPAFKRLALFAASCDNSVPAEQWVDWLLADEAWWLWAVDTQREVCRLLVLNGHNLTHSAQARLEEAILKGPPRIMFRDDIDPDRWQHIIESSTWLRLAKLQEAGRNLGDVAVSRVNALAMAHPHLKLEPHEREEFPSWMSGTGDPDYEVNKEIDIAPRKWRKLVDWLKKPARDDYSINEDTWPESCRKNMCNSLFALNYLAQENSWPEARWRTALQVWHGEKQATRSWRYAAHLVEAMPDTVLQNIAHSVAWWLRTVATTMNQHDDLMLKMCNKMLSLQSETAPSAGQADTSASGSLSAAINHPVGLLTEAVLHQWFARELHDNAELPPEIQSLFTTICTYRYGRIVLMQYLTTLFRVDRSWTEEHLLPLLNWATDRREAKAAWTGFLYSPRLYQPMLLALKPQFLETAHHYEELDKAVAHQYAAFLTYAALGAIEGYTPEDFRQAITSLPQEGLENVARTLAQALEGAGEQRAEYWENRVRPFWQSIWPKDRARITKRISASLVQMSIAAGIKFPAALAAVKDWLIPIDGAHYTLRLLHESGLCSHFPAEALSLLNCIINDQRWLSSELLPCLEAITQANPVLADEAQYVRLVEFSRSQ